MARSPNGSRGSRDLKISGSVIKDETSPLSVILVKSGSNGNRLLFRYPYEVPGHPSSPPTVTLTTADQQASTYGMNQINDASKTTGDIPNLKEPRVGVESDLFPPIITAPILDVKKDSDFEADPHLVSVVDLSDNVLTDLFAVKSQLCGQKFEVKINDLRFVGHPIRILEDSNQANVTIANRDLLTVNVVFALKANASHDIVNCYHECSKRITQGLLSEENREGYLSRESCKMLSFLEKEDHDGDDDTSSIQGKERAVFKEILERIPLAATLKQIFEDLANIGITHFRINDNLSISFCLPQKVHRLSLRYHKGLPPIGPSNIFKCLQNLRPYHGILLLVNSESLLESLPEPASEEFTQFLRVATPAKNLLELSGDANISLSHAFHVVAQLIYWGKASVIFPLCEQNVYAVHPLANTSIHDSNLSYLFQRCFNGANLLNFLSEFTDGINLRKLKTSKPRKGLVSTFCIH